MIITYIHRIGWFIGLVLLQVLILNNVHIAGYATPFLYIYFILKFSSGTSRNELMLWAFFFGLTIDIFSDTPGMNAAATVLLAFLRPSLLRLFTPRGNQSFPKIYNCKCFCAQSGVTLHRVLLIHQHLAVIVASAPLHCSDCNLYHSYRRD